MGNEIKASRPGLASGKTRNKGGRAIFFVIAVAVISYFAGKWCGGMRVSERAMKEQMRNWEQFAKVEESVLPTLPAHTNTMKSGNYIMQMWFADGTILSNAVSLTCANGQVRAAKFKRNGDSEILVNSGSVASWTEEGAGYEANAGCVGVVDGDSMWGHIYGWNAGKQSVGLWRIYPATIANPDLDSGARRPSNTSP